MRRLRYSVLGHISTLLVCGFALSALYFLEPPGSDQGLFMAEGDLLAHGASLYTQVWEHKPPGTPALYALALGLFGRDYGAIKLLDALCACAGALGLFALARRAALSDAAASLAGLAYLGFHFGPLFGGFWACAQAEVFIDPLLCGALWLLPPTAAGAAPR